MKLLKFGRNQSNEAREREIDEVLASPAWQAMRMAADKTNVETRADPRAGWRGHPAVHRLGCQPHDRRRA
ncbi:hypothetical protein [Burkholderia ubonensis]|uniref:hypothetical protein n=1 Tax=Burkholderia ubonensis TaxID=101571 RepID=UPI0018DF589D|nr:hypothetical protein [Burkholderia ubonensis]